MINYFFVVFLDVDVDFFSVVLLAEVFLAVVFAADFGAGFLAVFGAFGTEVSTTELSSLANSERTYLSAFQSLIQALPSRR